MTTPAASILKAWSPLGRHTFMHTVRDHNTHSLVLFCWTILEARPLNSVLWAASDATTRLCTVTPLNKDWCFIMCVFWQWGCVCVCVCACVSACVCALCRNGRGRCALVHACASITIQQGNSSSPPCRTFLKPMVHFSRSTIVLTHTHTHTHILVYTPRSKAPSTRPHTPGHLPNQILSAHHGSISPLTLSPPAETSRSHLFSQKP